MFGRVLQRWSTRGQQMECIFNQTGELVILPKHAARLIQSHASNMIDPGELTFIAACLMRAHWEQHQIIVEIGTLYGNTAVFMAKFMESLDLNVPILSIDPFERVEFDALNPQGSYRKYLDTILKSGVENVCLPLVAFSQQAAPVVPNHIGFLLIDGDHHYESIVQDLTLYAHKLVAGGLLFIDDYIDAYPGVIQATDEYLEGSPEFEILHKSYFVIARKRPAESD